MSGTGSRRVSAREHYIRDYVAHAPAPPPTAWKRAGVVSVRPDQVDALTTHEILTRPDTVMSVSPAGPARHTVTVLDYAGGWTMAGEDTWVTRASGRLEGRGRRSYCAPDGARFAALLATGPSDTPDHRDIVLVNSADGSSVLCAGEHTPRAAAWTPDSRCVVLTGTAGYRVHAATGECLFADESPKGWMAACITPEASQVFFIRRRQLCAMQLGTGNRVEAPDASPHAPPPSSPGWSATALAVSPRGDLVCAGTFDGHVFVWERALLSVVAEIRIAGPQIVSTKAAFSPDGSRLVVSADHVRRGAGCCVSHFIYDGSVGAIVAGTTTVSRFGHHAYATFSSDGATLYINAGVALIGARVTP